MRRIAVITGAAGGIGAATCDVFEEQGWDVVAVDREPVDRAGSLQVDVTDPRAVSAALSPIARIDALVNNAAIQLFKPLFSTTPAEWSDLWATNVLGAYACTVAVYKQLAKSHGAVVNVSSVHALSTSVGAGAYATTKGALTALTRAAALEAAVDNIRVNAVVPGAVETPALRVGLDRVVGAEQTLVNRTPLRRIACPREIAEPIVFLCDSARASFITGQTLVIDGGALARLSTE